MCVYILGSKTFKMYLLVYIVYKYRMLENFFIKIFLLVHQYYNLIWKNIFLWIGNIILIYHVNDGKMKNITFNYYLKYNLDKFRTGTFYAKKYDTKGMNHIAFNGNVDHINKIGPGLNDELPKRKKIILLNNGKPVGVDLQILDNYKINMKHFGESSISNLELITKMLGLKCTHVTIIEMFPFNKITMEIRNIDIEYLYH
jgi:hypothetical protein